MKSEKKHLLFSILVIFAAFACYKVISTVINGTSLDYYIAQPVKEVIFLGLSLLAAFKLNKMDVLRWKSKGWGTGLLVGIYFIIISIISGGLSIAGMWLVELAPTISVAQMLLILLHVVLVGITEELLFRGVLQNCFHDYFGEDSVSNVRKAIICTGLIFGFVHIFNVFSGASLSGAFFQMINVIPMGMLFAAVYYRSHKNLWVVALLHAINDAAAFISGGALMGAKTTDVISNYSAYNLVTFAIVMLIVLFVTRKKKLEQCLATAK